MFNKMEIVEISGHPMFSLGTGLKSALKHGLVANEQEYFDLLDDFGIFHVSCPQNSQMA
jgi:hypothetical protein